MCALRRRLERLEAASGAGEMPAELRGVFGAELARRREYAGLGPPPTAGERALLGAPGFRQRLQAAREWHRRHPAPTGTVRIAEALARGRRERAG